jgi:hypothetical protein
MEELVSSAGIRARRARRTTGRVLVSALGFAVAYYLDPENGDARRKQLQQVLQRTARHLKSVLSPEVEDPSPALASLR